MRLGRLGAQVQLGLEWAVSWIGQVQSVYERASFAYPGQDLVMVGEVGVALVAAVDLKSIKVGIVLETHPR